MDDLSERLHHVFQNGKNAKSTEDLVNVENEFLKLINESNRNLNVLFLYNEFRVSNAYRLAKTRPRILLGAFLGASFPPIPFFELSEFADIVMLHFTETPVPYESAIQCNEETTFSQIIQQLPQGFSPDFFWDYQVESAHLIPLEIEKAPFPTVASICHLYSFKTIENICELFDFVCPLSDFACDILSKKYSEKIINLPFGFNWGSFKHFIQPSWNKTIDLAVIFTDTDSPIFPYRNEVKQLCKSFKEKYKDQFNIQIIDSFLPIQEYIKVLQQSRSVINVTGIHGPYNYRTVESMSAGCMVFQFDWINNFFINKFSELFIDGVHGVSFTFENFEDKLSYYLAKPDLMEKIARQAYEFLNEKYSYKMIFNQLIEQLEKKSFKPERSLSSQLSNFFVNMAYYYQINVNYYFMPYRDLIPSDLPAWIKYNNLMVLSGSCPERKLENFIANLNEKELKIIQGNDLWPLVEYLFSMAKKKTPEEHQWLVHWNYLLLLLEKNQASEKDFRDFLDLLAKSEPKSFDEMKVVFKYFVNSSKYPKYNIGDKNYDFINLNIDIIKHFDNPQFRSELYFIYAKNAAEYFLTSK